MRVVYLGTSDFAAAVLRELAASRHEVALVVTPPDSRRGRGRRVTPAPAAATASELGIDVLRAKATERPEAMEAIRAAAPDLGVVCAFGQLIRDPLLDELELLNVHPSLLPRWRGAAPIERAIMAGDAETGVTIMRVTAGLDSGPIALREAVAVDDDDFGRLSGRLEALGARLLVEALDRRASDELALTDQDDSAATYAEKIEAADRMLDPGRPAIELERTVRALHPHIGAVLELQGGERLGVLEAAARADGPPAGEVETDDGLVLGCGEGALELLDGQAPGRASDGRGFLPARQTAAEAGLSTAVTPARRLAYETLRRTFEEGAWTDRAFTAGALRAGLDGRELAQARRLTYGAVQRRGTSDHLIAMLAGRRGGRVDDPALAALRLGLYELLFSGSADHAAVDQAVELAKHGLRRSAGGAARGRAATGFVNALLRRAAAERSELLASLDDSTPAGAAIAHSYPEWLVARWWEELGAAEARLLMAAMNEPAETALRVNPLRVEPATVATDLRAAGIEVTGPGAGGLLDPSDCLVVDVASEPVGARMATGELVAQSRGSQAIVALLDPRPEERVLDLCAGPGIKTTAIGARMSNRGELVSIESDARRASEVEALCARTGVTCARVEVADALEADLGSGYDRILLDPPCSDLGTLASRPDARWRKSDADCERLAVLQRRLLVRAARALRPGGTLVYSTCTISTRENEDVAGALGEYARGVEPDDLGAAHRRLASRRDRRFLQLLPERDHTTGFFAARFRGTA